MGSYFATGKGEVMGNTMPIVKKNSCLKSREKIVFKLAKRHLQRKY